MFVLSAAANAARVAPAKGASASKPSTPAAFTLSRPRRCSHVAFGLDDSPVSSAMEGLGGLGGDIGARDATPGEIESNFNAKSIGEADTEHMNKVPEGLEQFTALELRSCVVLDADAAPIEERLKLVYQKQVLDWKIRVVDGHEVLRREFRTENAEKAKEVINRLETVAGCEGQKVDSYIEGPGVRIELWSRAVNGLHANDFVMAAKLDKLDLSDVTIKKKPQTFLI